jgi:hypothetical protein
MKMFGNLTGDGLEQTGDRLGGGGVRETGAYEATVKLVYAGKASSSNAQSLTVLLDMGGQEYRETLWVTNKNGENFFLDKQDKTKKVPLPGFTIADDLCLLTTGMPLSEQTFSEKVVNIYDYDAKKEVPTNVHVLMDLIGKPVIMGVVKQTVDKTKKNDNTGQYDPTGETRDENVIEKVFHAESKRTVTEFRAEQEEAVFYGKWVEKNAGKTRNRSKGAEGKAGAPARPGAAPGAAAPQAKKSLFGG